MKLEIIGEESIRMRYFPTKLNRISCLTDVWTVYALDALSHWVETPGTHFFYLRPFLFTTFALLRTHRHHACDQHHFSPCFTHHLGLYCKQNGITISLVTRHQLDPHTLNSSFLRAFISVYFGQARGRDLMIFWGITGKIGAESKTLLGED